MRKLLLAEQSEEIVKGLERELKDQWSLSICTDGCSTLEALQALEPEAMIIDLSLPQKDGLTVLEESFPVLPPVILALTNFTSNYIEQTLADLGVGYVMQKPCAISQITHRITDMYAVKFTPVSKTARHLKALQMNNTYSGYKCLLVAIPAFKEDPDQLLHKELYAKVAKVCGLNDERCVDRVIRFAIQNAREHSDLRIWLHYFPANENGNTDCPTSKEFIKTIADII